MMVNGVLVDEHGVAWEENSSALAERLGYHHADFDLPAYTVRNLGFIHMRDNGDGIRVALRSGAFSLLTLAAALYKLLDRRPRRILLSVFWGDTWTYEIFATIGGFAERAEDLAKGIPVVKRPRWLSAERDLDVLALPSFAKVRPLVRLWRAHRGNFSKDVSTTLAAGNLLPRTVIVRKTGGSSRLVYEYFGGGIKLMRPCESFLKVGKDVDDLPDQEYGDWVARTYTEALISRRVRLQSVRATLRTPDAAAVRMRYDRLLMPWRRRGSDSLVLSISLRREYSPVV